MSKVLEDLYPITPEERRIVEQLDGHFCYDWDGLAVSAWTCEYDCCVDYKKTLFGRIVNWFVMKKFYRQERKVRARARRERLDALYTEKRRLEHNSTNCVARANIWQSLAIKNALFCPDLLSGLPTRQSSEKHVWLMPIILWRYAMRKMMLLDDKLKCISALAYSKRYFAPTDRTPDHVLPGTNRGIELLTEALEIVMKQPVEHEASK